MTAKRYIFFGPFSWRFGSPPLSGDSFIVGQVPDGPADVNTILLDERALTGIEYWHVRGDGTIVGQGSLAGCALSALTVSDELARLVAGESTAPLLVVTDANDVVRFFAQLRTGERDVLAIWCGEWTDPDRSADHGHRMAQALLIGLRYMDANRRDLSNHQRWFRRVKPGIEIEHKLTITSEVDIYGLTVHFRNLIGHKAFSDYMLEYRDDFQQWDFDNHLYEVTDPPEEAGYISFIPDGLGTTTVKRKWFTADAIERRESKWGMLDLKESEAEYIARRFGVVGRYLGSFRRRRCDIQFESVVSGNVHGFMVDRCDFERADWPDLCQVEVEYLKSRTLRTSADREVRPELRLIVDAVKAELDRLGVTYVESHLSKATYMRQLLDQSSGISSPTALRQHPEPPR